MPSLLIVAGEASGDLHGANLARELKRLRPDLALRGAGGRRMAEAGVDILHDPTRHASIGMVEALKNLGAYAGMYRKLVSALRSPRPDGAVLIDSPDFNLRFAERARDAGVPVVYYVSPQIWAWRRGRVKTVKRLVRKMLVILDFEERFYRDAGVDATFVGHPLLDAVREVDREGFRRGIQAGPPLVGLLPGSRRKQIQSLLPTMLDAAALIRREVPEAGFVVGCAPLLDAARLERFRRRDVPPFEAVWDRTPEVMASSDLLLASSGTTTLEAAIYGTPMIVTYKVHPAVAMTLGPLIRRRLQWLSLPNLIAGREVVPERYQSQARAAVLAADAVALLKDPARREEMKRGLAEVRAKLGEAGASRRAAVETLKACGLVAEGGSLGRGHGLS